MARSRDTESNGWVNPEVRFERSDISSTSLMIYGVLLALGLVITVPAMFWLGNRLLQAEQKRKETALLPASVEDHRLPPEPRLEYFESKTKPRVTPPRAAVILADQSRLLEQGDKARGIEPIEVAIDALAKGKLLKAREGGK